MDSTLKTWQCIVCGFIYDEEQGLPEEGIAPGTRWEDIPADWACPEFSGMVPRPDFAIYGEKDYQQLAVMRQMVRDLDMPLEIVGAPTIREPDGLAMSSRNRYLSDEERRIAPSLHRALTSLAAKLAAAGNSLDAAKAETISADTAREITASGFARIDYVAVRDADTLSPVGSARPKALRILAAAWLGKTRLIDNIAV